jgi:Ca-activated chloride channel family protein
MNTLFANIEFAKPFFLWLLLALPLLWFRYRDRRLLVLISRTLILALVIFTLADPQSTSEQIRTQEERIFAFDFSASIAPGMRRWMKDAMGQLPALNRNDRVFVFGSAATEVSNWRELFDGDGAKLPGVDPEKTSLENLLNSVLTLPATPRSLYLFTDGWETQGSVERLMPALAAAGIKVYPILPAQRPAIANVAVTKLLAPTQGNSGESLNLKVVLDNQNDRTVEGILTVTRNGQPIKTEAIKLSPGSQGFTYQTTPTEGVLTSYQATFTARDRDSDRYPSDNHAMAWVSVRAKAKILLINGHSGAGRYLEEIVKRQGLDITVRTAETAPAPKGYKVASFAPASYRQTPIEKILPVDPKEPPKPEEKNRAVVLVIDKSGSMRDDNRIIYAKEAAKAVARQLKDIDLLGVVGFDDSAFVVVYLETMARLRSVVGAQIDRLKPGGQTYFLPAMLEAKRQLERVNASRKHIILLSDGVTRGSQGELVDLVSTMKNDSKITVSAVAISNEADVRIMKRIAQYGAGLFHHVTDPSTLPQIVLEQLQDKPKEEPQNEVNLIPLQERGSELLAGFGVRTYPAVLGHMETDLKRGAQLDLSVTKQDRRLPLLASWHYGKGKSVAFTTDFEGRWSRNWIQWGGLQGFWGHILDWLSPPEENLIPAHEARVSFVENRSILDLSVFDESSANSQYRFTVTGKAGKSEGVLNKLAPGHYQASLPVSQPGDYRVDLLEERGGRKIAFPPIGYTLPYDINRELPRPDFNNRLLSRLAEATGGEINPRPPQASSIASKRDMVTKTHEPLRQPFILLAFGLFLLEVALRKFLFAESD